MESVCVFRFVSGLMNRTQNDNHGDVLRSALKATCVPFQEHATRMNNKHVWFLIGPFSQIGLFSGSPGCIVTSIQV